MKSRVGLWIDHRMAIVVSLTGKAVRTKRIISHMEKRVRFSGRASNSGAEDQRDRRFTDHLVKFYDKILSTIHESEKILIMGPGEAKGELKARLEGAALGDRVDMLETADKMTDRQVAARVQQHFRDNIDKTVEIIGGKP